MDFWTLIQRRYSVRAFDPRFDVSDDTVQRILSAAIEAPSAGNRQPWHFVVVRRQSLKDRLAEAAFGQRFLVDAPVVIVVCADPERSAARYGARGAELYCLQDTAAATMLLILAATDLRLGTCWIGAFDEKIVAQVLQLPAHLRPVAMVPIGAPARPGMRQSQRRPLDEVTTFVR